MYYIYACTIIKSLLLLILFIPTSAIAEIHKEAQICGESGKICFYWWPKLPKLKGWHQDLKHSYHYKMNAYTPDGFAFSKSETIIYAKAEYKKRNVDLKTVKEFIKFSQKQFISGSPFKLNIEKAKKIISKGKHKFISYSFKPEDKGNWEQVSYSEENDKDGNGYYLIFVLSSRSKEGYENNLAGYYRLLEKYE